MIQTGPEVFPTVPLPTDTPKSAENLLKIQIHIGSKHLTNTFSNSTQLCAITLFLNQMKMYSTSYNDNQSRYIVLFRSLRISDKDYTYLKQECPPHQLTDCSKT